MKYDKTKKAQSVDFKETCNLQTEMKVTQEHWDSIFHNWEEPDKCTVAKKRFGCTVCDKLKTQGYATKPNGDIYRIKTNVLIVGDVHSNYKALESLIQSRQDLIGVICVGDLALWKSVEEAQLDIQAYKRTKDSIEEFANNPVPFSLPVMVVKGNHDDYTNMYSKWFTDLNIHYVKQPSVLEVNNFKIGCLGGVSSDRKFDEDPTTFVGREHRFYVKSEIDSLKSQKMDMLITHQAAKAVVERRLLGKDEGSLMLLELLKAISPKYYIHGHHHVNYKSTYGDTKVFGLGNFSVDNSSYIVINTLTGEVQL
jgi:Icc-related predicted phosphoesterase